MLLRQDGKPDYRIQAVNLDLPPFLSTCEELVFAELVMGHSLNIPVLEECPTVIAIDIENEREVIWTPVLFTKGSETE